MFMFDLNKIEDRDQMIEIMQSSTENSASKIQIIDYLLNELHSFCLACAQKYTVEVSDKDAYDEAYSKALAYFEFIQQLNKVFFEKPEANNIKEKYSNYIFYANQCLFETYKPPHPSLSCFSPIHN